VLVFVFLKVVFRVNKIPSANNITSKKIKEVNQSLLFFLTIPINNATKKITGKAIRKKEVIVSESIINQILKDKYSMLFIDMFFKQ